MTKDEILQALRLTAMGRYGHDLQVQLAEKLEAVFAAPVQPATEEIEPVKRGPGRPKKAE